MIQPTYPAAARLVEVGPRDGLQNEPGTVPVGLKIELINRLGAAGLKSIESGAFVSPRWVPQMADTAAVLRGIRRLPGVRYPVLVPNMRGMEAAIDAQADEIAIFGAASETFSQKNINSSIEQSLQRFQPVCAEAERAGIPIRGYVSCVLGCPYEGEISPERVLWVSNKLLDLGCYEVSLGDTIGIGTAAGVHRLLSAILEAVPAEQIAVHFHDTYGQALANILAALEYGISVIDSSVAGLGGCPYAKGASGNVATEDVLYMLHGLGIESGVDLQAMVAIGNDISRALGRGTASRVALAMSPAIDDHP